MKEVGRERRETRAFEDGPGAVSDKGVECGLKIGQRQDSVVGKKARGRAGLEVEEVEARGFWCSTGTRDGLTGLVSSSLSRGRYGVRGPETLLLVW